MALSLCRRNHRNVWWVTSLSQPQPFWLSLKQWSPLPFITRELSSLTNLAAAQCWSILPDLLTRKSLFYPPDSKAELSVDSRGVGRVEKHGDSSRRVFSDFLFPIGETFQLPGSFYSLHLHLDKSFTANNSVQSCYLECIWCQTFPIFVIFHFSPEIFNCPGETKIGVLPGSCVTPGSRLHRGLLDLSSRTSLGSSAVRVGWSQL